MTLPPAESLTVEFKSDLRKLSDHELVLAAVCLANTEGGTIYLGVEDDGTVTGVHPDHAAGLARLAAVMANLTSPSVEVRAELVWVGSQSFARIEVPKGHGLVSTIDGRLQRRRLKADGTPECVPMLPSEFRSREASLRITDPSSLPLAGARLDDLDPVERARIRQFVEGHGGDRALLELDDEQLDGALALTARVDGHRIPTLVGLLLAGREEALRRLVPTHEIGFQVLAGEDVRLNEFRRFPLLRAFEWIETIFAPLNPEQEVQIGLFRVPVPLVDRRSYREAFANAVVHRDYSRLGAVHVRLEQDALVVSNPGGFVEGVTLANLLTTEPRPRNPALADALKRIGLVERTGRGVDLIFRGLLRFGRPPPDYSGSTGQAVVLRLPILAPDLGFLRLIIAEEEKSGRPLPIDALIALAVLRRQRRLTPAELTRAIQKPEAAASAVLEQLVERGLVDAHGRSRGRTYTLAAAIYASTGDQVAYTRQVGIAEARHEELVCSHAARFGAVRRADVIELCGLNANQATRLLARLVACDRLVPQGAKKGRFYRPGPRL